jgi:hypothetical protein
MLYSRIIDKDVYLAKKSATDSTNTLHSPIFDKSVFTKNASSSAATFDPVSSLISDIATLYPFFESAFTILNPIPLAPPVTIATFAIFSSYT